MDIKEVKNFQIITGTIALVGATAILTMTALPSQETDNFFGIKNSLLAKLSLVALAACIGASYVLEKRKEELQHRST